MTLLPRNTVFTEKKVITPESTNIAFPTETLPTSIANTTTPYVNGISPNPPSSEDTLSPKHSPPLNEPFVGSMHPESEALPPLASPAGRAPTHTLLSMHHTLFEEDEEPGGGVGSGGGGDRLSTRPGELVAATEC